MCGICGVVDFQREPRVETVERMADVLAHRGPDDAGAWAAGPVALGHRRLSIIDLSPDGHGPMHAPGGLAITYNGEIYNYRELRTELASHGHQFRTASDTEVVLEAYRAWGVDCVAHLNGIFAFVLWDGARERLFCARDRLGVKPLYLRQTSGRLAFASEAKALVLDEMGGEPPIDPAGLANYLAFGHAVGAQTIWTGIQKLLPGHCLLAGRTGTREWRYWDVRFETKPWREAEAIAAVRAGLGAAVRRQMVADVPVGAFLSGGVDSSAVVALMARETGQRVKTFAVGFVDEAGYSELPEAAAVARQIGTDHHEVELRSADLPAMVERLVWHYDEPFADAAAFPLLAVAQAARRQVTVVLTGEGGDELFGGYRRFAFERASPLYQRLPSPARSALEAAVGQLPRLRRPKQALRAMGSSDPATRAGAWLVQFDQVGRERLVHAPPRPSANGHGPVSAFDGHDPLAAYRACFDPRRDWLGNLLYADLMTWLPDAYLEKVDKATMAVGLEARVPILDHELVELAATLPSDMKIRGRQMKWVFKQAVADLLPAATLRRPKHGFAVPTDPWFRGTLRGLAWDALLGADARSRGLIERSEVTRLLQEHASGRDVHDTRLWILLNLELWLRQRVRTSPPE